MTTIVLSLGRRLRRRRRESDSSVRLLPDPPPAESRGERFAPVELRPNTGRDGKPFAEPTTEELSDDDLPRILRPDASRSSMGSGPEVRMKEE